MNVEEDKYLMEVHEVIINFFSCSKKTSCSSQRFIEAFETGYKLYQNCPSR
jgi:hypothetical protein